MLYSSKYTQADGYIMKLFNLLIIVVGVGIIISLTPHLAEAQINNHKKNGLGLGLILGEPTGASVKYWVSDNAAFDVGAAWSLADRNEALHMHTDILWHSWFRDTKNLAFYYGVGGRVIFADDAEAGIRLPLGLTYVFDSIPIDVFLEAAPILDLVPDTNLAGNGGVGIRYYF